MSLSAAIVLAAGDGTRMRSNKPKVLHAFAGKTFLNRVMDSVAALNPDTLAVVVHFHAERVAEAARSYDEQVTIVNQDDIPGTGRAVQCAMAQLTEAGKVDGPVLIAASDMPLLDSETLHRLVEFHTASGNGATVLTTIVDDPTGYGRIIRDREGNVLRIVEQKDANRSELAVQEVNTSVYVFEASVLTEAIAGLKIRPQVLLNDAVKIPQVEISQVPIIKGDAKSLSIAAASVIAKVTRDRLMVEYDAVMPGYDFAANKGYGTKKHIEGLKALGPSPIHRMTFIKKYI